MSDLGRRHARSTHVGTLDLASLALRERAWALATGLLIGLALALLVGGVVGPRYSALVAVRATTDQRLAPLAGPVEFPPEHQ